MKNLGLLLAAVVLAGCSSLEGPSRAQIDAANDARCRAQGATPGTDPYVICRAALDYQQANAALEESAARRATAQRIAAAADAAKQSIEAAQPVRTENNSRSVSCITQPVGGGAVLTNCN